MSYGLLGSGAILVLAHVLAGLAGLIAPYGPEQQLREYPWHPPTPLRLDHAGIYVDGPQPAGRTSIRWLSNGANGWKLFRAEEPGFIFLLGTDGLGRDQFSRLLHGARVSLYSGLGAAAVSAFLGFWLGGIAGFCGGWIDRLTMGVAEVFLVLPWMYLLLAARAFFPLDSDPALVFTALLLLLGAVGWARPARMIRGIALSTRERDYVLAAKGFGASPAYLLARHVLPPALPTISTYLSTAIPQYIAAEATLSFLGLGFSGSIPSWGTLVSSLANLEVLGAYWWMWIPAAALAGVLACYSIVSYNLGPAGGAGN